MDDMDAMVTKESKADKIKKVIKYLTPFGNRALIKGIIYLELLTVAGLMFCFGIVYERYTILNKENRNMFIMIQDHEAKINRLNTIVLGPGAQ